MIQSLCFTYTWSVNISYFYYQKAGRSLLNLQNLHWNVIGVIINKFPAAIPYLVVLYQIVTSVSSISLKLLVQNLPFSYELYLK